MGIFFKDKKQPEPKKEVRVTRPSTPQSLIPVDTLGGGMPSKDYTQHLMDVMQKNNQVGNDYLEFSRALKALEGQPINEEQKYIFTYPTYNAEGMTSAKLVNSAKAYLTVLAKEKEDFDRELATTREESISDKQRMIEATNRDIENLTKQVQEKTRKVTEMNEEINKSTISLNNEEISFNNAYANQVAIINDHITKFEKYLPYAKSTK